MTNAPLLEGYSYPSKLIQEYQDQGRLLSLRISLVPRQQCTLDCKYCYTTDGSLASQSAREQLTYEQRIATINEAISLCLVW